MAERRGDAAAYAAKRVPHRGRGDDRRGGGVCGGREAGGGAGQGAAGLRPEGAGGGHSHSRAPA
ncbi:MAG: hypothetical protein FJX74_25925 [Armatimonadetes bacterium]|nr:hypothetical protein [Armatimonadota bacterium]